MNGLNGRIAQVERRLRLRRLDALNQADALLLASRTALVSPLVLLLAAGAGYMAAARLSAGPQAHGAASMETHIDPWLDWLAAWLRASAIRAALTVAVGRPSPGQS